MSDPPTGTITFLFTDIEGSTRLWQQFPDAMPDVLARHHSLLREAIETHQGFVFQIVGDAFCAAFDTATDAIDAALAAQRALQARFSSPASPFEMRVRMGLHSGTAEYGDGVYHGYLALAHVQRLMSSAAGAQILVSQAACDLARDDLPDAVRLNDLGEVHLKDFPRAEHIYQLAAPDLPSTFPPLLSHWAVPNNLPLQLTTFIGRADALRELKRLLPTTRLLTLTGSGGIGKTRLSLQVAADVLNAYHDGVWFVELAPLSNPALIPQTMVTALGLREQPGQNLLQLLNEYLHTRTTLIVLDNCEHLIEECARLANQLLQAAPRLTILASSREPLAIAGELAWRVPSLQLPDPRAVIPIEEASHFEAIQLFVERARFAQAAFALTAANAPIIQQICRRLDGIPLAIELAAARVKVLPVEKIAERLDDRFRLLTGGSRSALPRQQTLRSTIDWSYALLIDAERVLLQRLSVFAGGWTVEAAEAVCAGAPVDAADILTLLTALLDKSLVVLEESSDGGPARYRLLETVRQYAREKLLASPKSDRVRDRHLDFFRTLAEESEPLLASKRRPELLPRLLPERDNLRVALEWAAAHHTESALLLAGSLCWFWYFGGFLSEGLEGCKRVLELPDAHQYPAGRAKALSYAGVLKFATGSLIDARAYLEEGIALWRQLGNQQHLAPSLLFLTIVMTDSGASGDVEAIISESVSLFRAGEHGWGLGLSLGYLGLTILRTQHDFDAACAKLSEGVAVLREVGDPWALGLTFLVFGHLMLEKRDYAASRSYMEEAVSLHQSGERFGLGTSLYQLAGVVELQGDYSYARQLFEKGLLLSQEIGSRRLSAENLLGLGQVAWGESNHPSALQYFGQSLLSFREQDFPLGIARSLFRFALVRLRAGQPDVAARLYAAADILLQSRAPGVFARVDRARTLALLQQAIAPALFAEAAGAASKLTLDQAIDLAMKTEIG